MFRYVHLDTRVFQYAIGIRIVLENLQNKVWWRVCWGEKCKNRSRSISTFSRSQTDLKIVKAPNVGACKSLKANCVVTTFLVIQTLYTKHTSWRAEMLAGISNRIAVHPQFGPISSSRSHFLKAVLLLTCALLYYLVLLFSSKQIYYILISSSQSISCTSFRQFTSLITSMVNFSIFKAFIALPC